MSHALDDRLTEALEGTGLQGARILNAPAGDGALSLRWAERGHDVTSVDLFPDACQDATCLRADLNERLPFPDAHFDAVVSQEGVEHLEDLPGFLRECARVLVPGGHLWITTPNVMDMSSRMAWMLGGVKAFHGLPPNEETTLWGYEDGRAYHGHAFSLPWFQLRYLMRIAQFDEITLDGSRPSLRSTLLFPLGWLTTRLLLWRIRRRSARRNRRRGRPVLSEPLADQLRRDACSSALLRCRTVVAHAVLRPGSFAPPDRTPASVRGSR